MTDPIALYEAMDTKSRRQVLLAEYRCRTKGCLLLHIWQSPQGPYWYSPAYVTSPVVTKATSVEEARQRRTSDGYRRWNARAGSFGTLLTDNADSLNSGQDFACDHVRGIVTYSALATTVAGSTPGSPVKLFVPDNNTPGIVVLDEFNRPIM